MRTVYVTCSNKTSGLHVPAKTVHEAGCPRCGATPQAHPNGRTDLSIRYDSDKAQLVVMPGGRARLTLKNRLADLLGA